MSKPIIAVDMDEVMVPFVANFIEYHNAEYGTNYAFTDHVEYSTRKLTGDTHEEITKKYDAFIYGGHAAKLQPSPDAVETLKALSTQYELIVVTAREKSREALTRSWLSNHAHGIFSKLYLLDRDKNGDTTETKMEACQRLGASVLIDDHLDHLLDSADYEVQGLLFGNYPWNQSDKLPAGVRRVSGWKEVGEILL